MKRLLFFIMLCVASLEVIKAQDIIVTRESKRIDAVVIEISEQLLAGVLTHTSLTKRK